MRGRKHEETVRNLRKEAGEMRRLKERERRRRGKEKRNKEGEEDR